MSLPNKILPADYAGHDVQSLADQPAISSTELKAVFDYVGENVVIPKINALLDAIANTATGNSGAKATRCPAIAPGTATNLEDQNTEISGRGHFPGFMHAYAGNTAPAGWLMCDGSVISRATYAALFAVIGTTYGAGDGSTTFNVPDLRGRVPVGKSADAEFFALGQAGGEKAHSLTGNENGTHTHGKNIAGTEVNTATAYMNGNGGTFWNMAIGIGGGYSFSIDNSGFGTPHNNLQPYNTVNYIIKY